MSTADAYAALSHLYDATYSLIDALCHYMKYELASVSPVYEAIEQWHQAKDTASQQILRAAYLVPEPIPKCPQPSTVLLHELHELGRECDLLNWVSPPDPGRMRDLLTFYGIGYFKELVDRVRVMGAHWDKLTGLLGQPGQNAAPPARSARGMSREEANVQARKYLRTHPHATARELRDAIGCGLGQVPNLSAWQALQERRPKAAKPKVVSLTQEMQAAIGEDDPELRALISDQERDQKTGHRIRSRQR